jgi:NTE family protein
VLSSALDILRIRQYFNAITATRTFAAGVRDDASFLDAVRHALLPLPVDSWGTEERRPFDHVQPVHGGAALRHRWGRVAVLATGGSGALASVVGVARALEEAGIEPCAYSLCSGSALFGFPLATGRSAGEVAEFVLGLRTDRCADVDWAAVGMLAPRLARGFTGLMRGEKLEALYRQWLGDITLAELPIPAYAPVWNVERNRVEYIGPASHPHLPVARAVHLAVSLPLFFRAVQIGRYHYYDGGTVDILPTAPLLDMEPRPDSVLTVNAFYPHEFHGEDETGWTLRRLSILHAAAQVKTCQHIELARRNMAQLRSSVAHVELLEPVPYATVKGIGLYAQFLDTRRWPEFMRAGHRATARTLAARSVGAHARAA